MQIGKKVPFHNDRAQLYLFLGRIEVEAYDVVITCTIFVCKWMTTICLIQALLILVC